MKMERLCSACLSVDRKLFKLENLQFFYDLLIPDTDFNLPEVQICWECRKTLIKCSSFQRNALTARDWLISFCLDPNSYDEQDLLSQSYSTLVTKLQTKYDYIYLYEDENNSTEPTSSIKQECDVHYITAPKISNTEALSNIKVELNEVTESPLPALLDNELIVPSPLPTLPDDDPLCEATDVDPATSNQTLEVPMIKNLKLLPSDQMPKQLMKIDGLPGTSKSNVIKLTKISTKQIQLLRGHKANVGHKILRKIQVTESKGKEQQTEKHLSTNEPEPFLFVKNEVLPVVMRKKKIKQVKAKKVIIKPVAKNIGPDAVPIPTTDQIYEHFRTTMNEEIKKNFKIKVMTEEELEIHRRDLRKDPQYANSKFKCHDCIVGYYTEQQLEDHTAAKHFEPEAKLRSSRFASPGTQQCPTCRAHVPSGMFAFHYGRHRVLYECVTCGAALVDVRRAPAHVRSHDAPNKRTVFECAVCQRAFASRHQLRAHKETHLPGGAGQQYTCEICGKGFNAKWSLDYHLKRHTTQQEPVKCRVCKKEYKNRYTFASHYRNVHDRDPSAQFRCEPCDLRFVSAQCLATHLRCARAHAEPAHFKHICPTCGKGFMSERHLKDHDDYVHKGSTDYICNYCDKMYSSAGGLRKHVKFVHEGVRYEKNKKCTICGKAFTSPKTLREHQNIHNGTRPFKCLVCGDTFKQSAALYTHRRLVHLGYKMRNKKVVKMGEPDPPPTFNYDNINQ